MNTLKVRIITVHQGFPGRLGMLDINVKYLLKQLNRVFEKTLYHAVCVQQIKHIMLANTNMRIAKYYSQPFLT